MPDVFCCRRCGFCCVGNDFVVSIAPGELERFAESDRVMNEIGTWHLRQREDGSCVYFDAEAKSCVRYADRPANCALYRCNR